MFDECLLYAVWRRDEINHKMWHLKKDVALEILISTKVRDFRKGEFFEYFFRVISQETEFSDTWS